jgi:hypothetical protein
MRKASKTVSTWLGIAAGLAGLEHGYFEILQGSTQPDGWMILSMGPPCDPAVSWNACEPAMTLIPNFLLSGILSFILGLAMMVWSAAFVQRRHGGGILILLSIALLLCGGGLFPPLIGLIGGATAAKIHKPLGGAPGGLTRFSARLWPWPLAILMTWLLGQFLVGYLFNDFLKSVMGIGLLLILSMLPLSVYTAYAHDAAQ